MSAIQTRNSVVAIKPETTEGTPVVPAAATDFVPIQDDFTMEPAFDVLDSAELKSSIGKSKSILGAENPTASFSVYLHHSGVEGQAPQLKELLKAAFGATATAGTEYDTVAASTVSLVKVNTGEGANFRRGQALLVKDPTNGYSIRPVHSISGDNLTLGFTLPAAPALGVNLGKAVTYYPADSDHQALSVWHYTGNGGAVQLMSGAKVTELGLTFEAGQLINGSYSLEGLAYFFDPIEITTAKHLDFTDDDGTFAVAVASKMYKDPHELAEALTVAMNASGTTETHAVTYSNTTGKFTITNTTGSTLSLLWSTGTNTATTIGTKLGFTVSADDTAATTYTSDSAISFTAPYSPSFDAADPLAAKSNQVLLGDATDNTCFQARSVNFTIANTRSVVESVCAASGRSSSLISGREVTITVAGLIDKYDAEKFKRFRTNADTRFMYAFGEKSGGNWVAGKAGAIYVPTATISSFSLTDEEGLVSIELELKAYVDSTGAGEVYISFV